MTSQPAEQIDTAPNAGAALPDARQRVRSLDELAAISQAAKDEGKRVVLAHGVFDLLHLGHLRHLEAARRMGDMLIVTVTADAYVNKGPGRPAFADALRAEMLAALDPVDWTGVNASPTAETVLRAIRPAFYVKGSDYSDDKDDITGKIADERALVESLGGKLAFTDEITFSSSELINAHIADHDPEIKAYLESLKHNVGAERLLETIDRLAEMRVLIVGETIIDQYSYVKALGKPAKESIVAALYRSQETFAGGVVAAANHAAGFCGNVEVLTGLGSHDSYEILVRESLRENVTLNAVTMENRQTVRKERLVEESTARKLFEVYHMDDTPSSDAFNEHLGATIEDSARDFDLVVVFDFGHGFIAPRVARTIEKHAPFLAVNAQTNAGNNGHNPVTKYRKADFVCIDEPEARLAVHDKYMPVDHIIGHELPSAIAADKIAVTCGGAGCYVWKRGDEPSKVPAFAHKPVDTIGAGDAFLAVTAPVVASGASMNEAGFIGSIAAGLKTGVIGHRSAVDRIGVKKSIVGLLK